MKLTKRTQNLIDLITDDKAKEVVLELLNEKAALYGPECHEVLERIQFSVVKLALQGEDKLKLAKHYYKVDTRDLLVESEFATCTTAHEKWYNSLGI